MIVLICVIEFLRWRHRPYHPLLSLCLQAPVLNHALQNLRQEAQEANLAHAHPLFAYPSSKISKTPHQHLIGQTKFFLLKLLLALRNGDKTKELNRVLNANYI